MENALKNSDDGFLSCCSYYVQLPDPRIMKVEYYVDDWGYHPTITFEGEAVFPPSPSGGGSGGGGGSFGGGGGSFGGGGSGGGGGSFGGGGGSFGGGGSGGAGGG